MPVLLSKLRKFIIYAIGSRVIKFIQEKDLEELGELTLFHIAQEFGVSQSHLCRCFNKNMNMKLNHYFQRIKLLKCALLMQQEPSLTVKDISKKSGFSNPDYFNKVFKKHFCKAPSIYFPFNH